MEFKISKDLIQQIVQLIQSKNNQQLEILLNDMHHADFAEILFAGSYVKSDFIIPKNTFRR